jgi:membrane carboxypeptidase/penicillin-binding protein PbpC
MSQGEYHLTGLLWTFYLPQYMSADELLSLYCASLPYKGGRGLHHAARFYFQKPLSHASTDEILYLLAVSYNPGSEEWIQRRFQQLQKRYAQ